MSTQPSAGPRLNDDELRQLAVLLARYATHDLDQFDHWRIETPYASVFVDISLRPRADISEDLYRTIWPLPPVLAD
jgi:hypothetical protein